MTDLNWKTLLHQFLNEVFEATICILIINVALNKGFDLEKIIQLAIGIGSITFILEYIHPDYNISLKQGISWSSGAALMSAM